MRDWISTVVIAAFAVLVLGLLLLFNWAQQPEGLDRNLLTIILGFLAPVVATLLNNINNNAQVKELRKGQEEIKEKMGS